MHLTIREVHLPLRHPFTITHGTTTVQHNVIVELSDGTHTGYGEAATSRGYPHLSAPVISAALESLRPVIESARWDNPEDLWDQMLPHLYDDRFSLCAVDEAAHDLWGKRLGQPVWQLWGLSLEKVPCSDYTIGIDTTEVMIRKMQEFPNWPIYKIKLGTNHDVEIVRTLREHTDAVFRIDANTAWTVEQTLEYAPALKELGVEFLEQPLPRDDWEGMARLKRRCALPVIADESCLIPEDVARCAEFYDGVNIKLTKAGGQTPGRRMALEARRRGLKVMAGCMNESSIGISAIGMLLPLLDYVDMDGSVLIAKDIAEGVWLDRGVPTFPDHPGNGVRLLPDSPE